MTSDDTALVQALRLHAYELVNGGTNASQLQHDLRKAASRLDALSRDIYDFYAVILGIVIGLGLLWLMDWR